MGIRNATVRASRSRSDDDGLTRRLTGLAADSTAARRSGAPARLRRIRPPSDRDDSPAQSAGALLLKTSLFAPIAVSVALAAGNLARYACAAGHSPRSIIYGEGTAAIQAKTLVVAECSCRLPRRTPTEAPGLPSQS